MKDIITITTVNFAPIWGDKERNLNRILGYIEAAAARGSNLIVFPETALTGYDDDSNKPLEEKMHRRLAETIPGSAANKVAELTKKLGIYAVFGMPERDSENPSLVYNSAAACGPEGIIGSYRKVHLPFVEVNWSVRGSKPFMFDTPWGLVGISICYDTYVFPELMRYYRAKGARLTINCTAIATGVGANNANTSLQYNCATQTMFIASANMFGMDVESNFMGGSSIIGPASRSFECHYYGGKPFGTPGADEGDMITATVDLSYADRHFLAKLWKSNPKTGSPDWRPDVYIEMLKEVLDNPNWGK